MAKEEKKNPYLNHKIEFHILQSFPVTCLNRDDVGAPKTAIVGGTTRARVSSQCWKRQVRLALHDFGIKLAVRTKKIEEMIADACKEQDAKPEAVLECAKAIANFFKKGKEKAKEKGKAKGKEENDSDKEKEEKDNDRSVLLFFSGLEAKALAEYAKKINFDPKKVESKEATAVVKKAFNPALDGVDIALFGRMVAKAADLNVEAAASFSHAISTHKVVNEVEFFSALDDLETGLKSAHLGSLEFNSATYYRYVSLDLGQLFQTLGDADAMLKSIEAFVKALYIAVPSARQTTQSGASPWEFARVLVRKGQRLQVPFETAVKAKDGGFLAPSIEALDKYINTKKKISGSLFMEKADFRFGLDEKFDIDKLLENLVNEVKKLK